MKVNLDTLSQIDAGIIGVLGLAKTALSTKEVYEALLIGEAYSYFELQKRLDKDKAVADYVRFMVLVKQNKEKEARKLVKDIPLSVSYNTMNRHLELLEKSEVILSKSAKDRKQKRVWYLSQETRKEFEKIRPVVFPKLEKALENFFTV